MTVTLTGWWPTPAKLARCTASELLDLALLAHDHMIRARIRGDAYGVQVCRERRAVAEKLHAQRLIEASYTVAAA